MAIDNGKFFGLKQDADGHGIFKTLEYPWIVTALQTACVIQKLNRTKPQNKGKSLLVFDEEDEFSDQLAELLAEPPDYIDSFVPFDESKEKLRLNQIIDSAYFVKSHHSSMAQVVDMVSYFLRLHLELNYYGFPEAYPGERDKVAYLISIVADKLVPASKVYPSKESEFTNLLRDSRASGIESVLP